MCHMAREGTIRFDNLCAYQVQPIDTRQVWSYSFQEWYNPR